MYVMRMSRPLAGACRLQMRPAKTEAIGDSKQIEKRAELTLHEEGQTRYKSPECLRSAESIYWKYVFETSVAYLTCPQQEGAGQRFHVAERTNRLLCLADKMTPVNNASNPSRAFPAISTLTASPKHTHERRYWMLVRRLKCIVL
jgi:hypothetical protein